MGEKETGLPDGRQLLREWIENGSEEAFTRICRRYSKMIYGVCFLILGDPHEAEDAVQATLLFFWKKARKLPGHFSLEGWLFQTARLTALEARRSRYIRLEHEKKAQTMKTTAKDQTPESCWVQVSPASR